MTDPIQTKRCPECGESLTFDVSADAALRYLNGDPIQLALPMLTEDERERFMTGLHGECWNKVMATIDDELEVEQ